MSPVDGAGLRRIMGVFATGVAVMTTQVGREMHGMTANGLTSVSLDPPLVLVCLRRATRMLQLVRESGAFALNFLSADQENVSDHYAGRPVARGEVHFVPWEGGPRLSSCLGAVACSLERLADAGDHVIAFGRVVSLFEGDQRAHPLLFFRGRYGDIVERPRPDKAPPIAFDGLSHLIYYDSEEV